MTTDRRARRWLARLRPRLSLRMRLLGWALLLLTVASLASVVTIRQVLLNQVENRVSDNLAQEVAAFRLLADGNDPTTGQPFGTDLVRIAEVYLSRNEPQAGEQVLMLVDGEFYAGSVDAANDLSRETDLLARWGAVTASQWGEVETGAGPVRWLAVPVVINGETRGQMVVAQQMSSLRSEVDQAVQVMAAACLLVIVVVGAGGYLAMGRALRPLRGVTETARMIEATDLARRIEVSGTDEVARLGRTFNAMVGRLEQAFAAQQALLSDVGHELRTPITIVRGHLELLGDDPEERRETVALVIDELDRMSRMVNDLLVLARAGRPDFLRLEEVDVAAMMADVYAKATALGEREWRLGEVVELSMRADPQRLTQALMQLVQNAAQFTTAGDVIALSAQAADGQVRLAVRDTGAGIEAADRERIFERFTRGQAGRHRADGAGLGLAIVAAIAAAHRGHVTVDSEPGEGSTFTLELPLRPELASQPGPPAREPVSTGEPAP